MKKISEYLFLWGIGGWIYYSLEIIFRGFSHWSMFVPVSYTHLTLPTILLV